MTLAYSPFDVWPIVFISLSLLILAVRAAPSEKIAARYGFSFGLGWFAAGISWVHNAIADFGGLPLIASLFLMLLLCSYLALYPALFSYLVKRFSHRYGLAFIIAAWLATEWLRGTMLTGFPWLSIGYSQLYSPLSGFAPIVGEVGLQTLILTICLLMLSKHKLGYLAALGMFLLGGALKLVQWHEPTSESLKLALVQGNIEQSIKWRPDSEWPTMVKYLDLSRPYLSTADVIIWPEAAIPRLEVMAQDYLEELNALAANHQTAIVTGIVDYQPNTEYAYNNMVVLGKKHKEDELGQYHYLSNNRYSKHHLLPIGEFVPFESVLRQLAPIFDLPMSSFSRGSYRQDNLVANGYQFSSAICFEIAFSSQLRANLYDDSNAILTLSNDAWFGNSHGPWQHLQIAQMRALEYAKPVIRVTNNGITAIVSESGEIIEQLPQNKEVVMEYDLKLSSANTPYKQLGNFIYLLLVMAVILNSIFITRIKNNN